MHEFSFYVFILVVVLFATSSVFFRSGYKTENYFMIYSSFECFVLCILVLAWLRALTISHQKLICSTADKTKCISFFDFVHLLRFSSVFLIPENTCDNFRLASRLIVHWAYAFLFKLQNGLNWPTQETFYTKKKREEKRNNVTKKQS